MKTSLPISVLVLLLATSSLATPLRTQEYGAVPEREQDPARELCTLGYYNLCSGWVWNWEGYCGGAFNENLPVKYGVCFDLGDCPFYCGELNQSYWATKCFSSYGRVDIEIYCADEKCCPIGFPMDVVYGYIPDPDVPWQLIQWVWDLICLKQCDPTGGKFVILITDWTAGVHTAPSSDHVPRNVEAGCQEWRCQGHSYIYKNAIDYCQAYGEPAPMWVSGADYGCTGSPAIPPGCHDYPYNAGVYAEFLIECPVECWGVSGVDDNSWSEIKELYR